jgi:tetratricopeptide (TPR) repeat protein
MEDQDVLPEDQNEEDGKPRPDKDRNKRKRLYRILGFVFIVLAVLLGVYGFTTYFALQRGQLLRDEGAQQAFEDEMEKQIGFASEDIEAGNYSLAVKRLEWILQRDPDHPEALSLLQLTQENIEIRDTPTPFPTVTRFEAAEQNSEPDDQAAEEFSDIEQLIIEQDWQAAVLSLTNFQSQFPDYRRRETDAMLYNAYLNLGQELVMGDQVELGIFYFSQAEKLGDLPSEAEDQRVWAELYLLGISYYGVNWEIAVSYFRGLCAAAPFYQNACEKLHEALIAYGDQFAGVLDWCPAEEIYAEAYRVDNDALASEKLSTARSQCLEATPTPAAPISGTVSIDGSLPQASPEN